MMAGVFCRPSDPPWSAIVAGAVLLLTRRIKSEKIYAEIDWTLLLMFAGLFIVVAGLEEACSPRRSLPRWRACISKTPRS